jgi:hypothetical protein
MSARRWNIPPVKTKEEPSQPATAGGGLAGSVCRSIATFVCHSYPQFPLNQVHVSNTMVRSCGGTTYTSGSEAWTDFIQGVATTLNPLPAETSHMSNPATDRLALLSDWQTVTSDLEQVWSGVRVAQSCIDKAKHERSGTAGRTEKEGRTGT